MQSAAGNLEWSVAARPYPGEPVSGDGHLVEETAGGWLLAVADGLGHGREAAAATRALMEVLHQHAHSPLPELMRLGHERLRTTRGGAVTLAAIDNRQGLLTWLGVGNVEGLLLHAETRESDYITRRGGIVGVRLPELQPSVHPVRDGDLLAFATDGIAEEFPDAIHAAQPVEVIARHILAAFAKPRDDALVLVARWRQPLAGTSA